MISAPVLQDLASRSELGALRLFLRVLFGRGLVVLGEIFSECFDDCLGEG